MPDIFASASGPKVGVVPRGAPARHLYIAAALGAVSLFATSSQAQELRVGAGYAPHAPEKGSSVVVDYLFKPSQAL
ncbi:MAG: hypothetical protein U1A07_15850, partial [Phenylobacterium sp.]|nr:hypothetical protein [Phenylobacterium sp.]